MLARLQGWRHGSAAVCGIVVGQLPAKARETRSNDAHRPRAAAVGPRRHRRIGRSVRRAATWLRDNPGQARGIGISSATDARALAVVLDILAVEVPHLDSDLRRQTVQNRRDLLGETLIRPAAGAGPDPTTARV